ncbi:hypothetical protein LTR49_028301 [Elasticomyces elasticus]|nr:hypothetical protein LTR49_028301 [Elasticomyces elasticus]
MRSTQGRKKAREIVWLIKGGIKKDVVEQRHKYLKYFKNLEVEEIEESLERGFTADESLPVNERLLQRGAPKSDGPLDKNGEFWALSSKGRLYQDAKDKEELSVQQIEGALPCRSPEENELSPREPAASSHNTMPEATLEQLHAEVLATRGAVKEAAKTIEVDIEAGQSQLAATAAAASAAAAKAAEAEQVASDAAAKAAEAKQAASDAAAKAAEAKQSASAAAAKAAEALEEQVKTGEAVETMGLSQIKKIKKLEADALAAVMNYSKKASNFRDDYAWTSTVAHLQ